MCFHRSNNIDTNLEGDLMTVNILIPRGPIQRLNLPFSFFKRSSKFSEFLSQWMNRLKDQRETKNGLGRLALVGD